MTTISITATGAAICAEADGPITARAVGILVGVNLDTAWDDLTPKLWFRSGGLDHDIPQTLDLTGSTTVPSEALIAGKELLVGLDGWDAQGTKRIPTRWATLHTVLPSTDNARPGERQPEPTPGIVDQILNKATSAERMASAVQQAAAAGEFDGEPGAPGRDGQSPYIGPNGTWIVYDGTRWHDTGIQAQGDDYRLTEADRREIAALARYDDTAIKGDLTALQNTGDAPAPAGKVWTATEDGAGWAYPQGGSGGGVDAVARQGLSALQDDFSQIAVKPDAYYKITANSDGVVRLDGYIRGPTVSYSGAISSSATNGTYFIQLTEDCLIYFEANVTSAVFRLSNEEPKTGNAIKWTGNLWNQTNYPTKDTPFAVSAGQYLAWYEGNNTDASGISVYVSTDGGFDINANLPTIQTVLAGIESYSIEFWKYAIDKVLCIGDSLTAGSSYERNAEGNQSWLGNINENYPYQLSRMLNCTCVNGGDGGETTLSWYNKHFAKYDFSKYSTVIIWLGTNGNFTDTIDADTASGDYNTYAETNTGRYCRMIEEIKIANPRVQIIMVNYYSATADGKIGRSVLPKIAERYGLPIVNLDELETAKAPIFHGNVGNVHLSKAGYLYVANKICKTLIDWFSADLNRVNYGQTVGNTISDTEI